MRLRCFRRLVLGGALVSGAAVAWGQGRGGEIRLSVDLRDAPRRMLHATEEMPVRPGALTLVYPKWIPGEHGPTGPLDNFAGLVVMGNGQRIEWERDKVDMYAFRLLVPQGVTLLEIKLDYLATAAASGFSAGASTSANLALLSWNTVVLYPAGAMASEVMVAPSVTVPDGWKFGTALKQKVVMPTNVGADTTMSSGEKEAYVKAAHFETVSLEQLVDSPVLTGRWFREVALAPEVTPRHFLDMAADGPEDLQISGEHVAAFSKLVRETGALYRSRHYGEYHFLVTLSDQVAHFGLEHHQSSDDRVPEKTFVDDARFTANGDLLPHEFTHSWNGKYRRPLGLATGNYQEPMKGDLLWVYEGLTEYLGDVLAARSGIWTAEQYRGFLADSAAELDHRPGRTWRNIQDTATAAQVLGDGGSAAWDNWRLALDYYAEGELIWLDVDTTIREKTKGKRSLNDFVAAFHGLGGNTPPKVVTYTFDDVVTGLNAVVENDWGRFLRERLDSHAAAAPTDGIGRGGYRLVYGDAPNVYARELEGLTETVEFWYSLGMHVSKTGGVSDVLRDGVSDLAGIGPGMTIVAVNGRAFTPDLLRAAVREAKGSGPAVELILENTGYFEVVKLEYHEGERYPFLERMEGTPARLDEILRPMTR